MEQRELLGEAERQGRYLSEAQRREVADLYAAGQKTCDLMARFGVTGRTICNCLRRHAVAPRGLNRPLPETVRQAAVAAYQAAGSIRKAARKAGCSTPSVLKALSAAGLSTNRRRVLTTPEQRAAAVAAYQFGANQRVAAGAAGLSAPTLRKALRDIGARIRTISEARREYERDDTFFREITTEEQAWALGLIASDGNVTGNCLQVKLDSEDEDALETLRALLKYTGPIGRHQKKDGWASYLHIKSDVMAADLARLGIVPNKSLILEPPPVPAELQRHLWRGFIDGDGHLGRVRRSRPDGAQSYRIELCGTYAVVRAFTDFVLGTIAERGHSRGAKAITPSDNIFAVSFKGVRLIRQMAQLLYGGARVAMRRKAAIAAEMMAAASLHRDWSALTAERLLSLRQEHGTWKAVAAHLGIDLTHLWRTRRKLGI